MTAATVRLGPALTLAWASLCCIPLCSAVPARADLGAAKASYEFVMAGMNLGQVDETFRRTGDRYEIESVARPNGLAKVFFPVFSETSKGSVSTTDGLRPDRFEHRRSDDESRTQQATFDRNAGSVALQFDGRVEKHELTTDLQDALSMKYQFAFRPPPESGESVIAMTNGKSVTRYRYRLVDHETLETPAGRFDTVHYAKIAQEGESRFELWLAKSIHYLPVKILGEEKGRKAVQTLISVTTD